MAQIGPKTILQSYMEHQGSNQPEKGHQKCQKIELLANSPDEPVDRLKQTCRTGWASFPTGLPVEKNS